MVEKMTFQLTKCRLIYSLSTLLATLSALFFINAAPVHAESTNPEPTHDFVFNDYAHVLDENTRDYVIERSVQMHKLKQRPQVVLITLKSTGNLSIDDYTDSLVENARWKAGDAGQDNGVLIVWAHNDGQNNVRINVGYGLESTLTDAETHHILMNNFDNLKSHNDARVNEGLKNVYAAVADNVENYYKAQHSETTPNAKDDDSNSNSGFMVNAPFLILLSVFIFGALQIFNKDDDDDAFDDDKTVNPNRGSHKNLRNRVPVIIKKRMMKHQRGKYALVTPAVNSVKKSSSLAYSQNSDDNIQQLISAGLVSQAALALAQGSDYNNYDYDDDYISDTSSFNSSDSFDSFAGGGNFGGGGASI